ncbi:MAG: YidC/Oxa1 family membrane protein insertase [Acholeplasmataceae bacterium]|jgi:YidC/Oxa1 family membrane protein insertase
MKKRFLLIAVMLLMLALGLSGCRRDPKPIALIASVPDQVVVDGSYDLKSMKVYRIYETGAVELVDPDDERGYNYEFKSVSGGSNIRAGVEEIHIEDKYYKYPKDKKRYLETSIRVVNKQKATDPIDEIDSFLAFQFKEVTDENNTKIKKYAFTHNLGYSFVKDEVSKYLTIFKVSNVNGETVQTDVTEEVAANLVNSTEEDFPIRYETGKFPVELQSGAAKGSFDVFVIGGEKPIHSKSANWFDYILVIPIGWLMQLFSFGGIYGLGIIFATIVIRTLAWPIYAKTNSMSANMAEAQPDIQRLQAKYRHRTDKTSQQQMQIEMMQIYKKHKIGLGSFFLPFLQMPIFIAMYQTVTRILVPGGYWAEKISNTRFLGVDLSIGSHWASSYILAALVGITMLLLQWISQRKPAHLKKTTEHKKDDQAAQTARTMKIVSYIMVIMMVFFAFRSNALALYWVIGNLFSLGQTLIHRQLAKKRYEKKQEETLGGIL